MEVFIPVQGRSDKSIAEEYTKRGISSKLLEAICTRRLTDEDIQQILKPVQVRFT